MIGGSIGALNCEWSSCVIKAAGATFSNNSAEGNGGEANRKLAEKACHMPPNVFDNVCSLPCFSAIRPAVGTHLANYLHARVG